MTIEEQLAIALAALQTIAFQGYDVPRALALKALARIRFSEQEKDS